MNRTPDVELVLRDYFADDGLTAPDFILDVVEARISRQPQRLAWPFPGRTNVTTPIKLIAGLAAALIVAVVGYSLLPRSIPPGASAVPTASARPTAAVTTAPSAGVVFPEWFTPDSDSGGAGILPAGTVTTRSFLPGSTFRVPAGWVNDLDVADLYGLFPDTPANEAEFALSGGMAQSLFMGIVDTPTLICDGGADTAGSTAAELADSLVTNEALVTSNLVDVTIGDLTGTRVDAHLDPDWTGSCTPYPDDPPTKDYKDYRGRFVFLDVPDGGKLLIVVDSDHAADFEAFLVDAMPVVESFRFDLAQ